MGLFSRNKNTSASNSGSNSNIDLRKEKIQERSIILEKVILEKGISGKQSRVALVLDYSYSMDSLYRNGSVQKLVERLLPVGVKFDDNQAIDLFIFSNNGNEKFICEVSPNEFDGVVENKVLKKYSMGGTNYAGIIRLLTKKYTSEKGDPAYIMFVADGDCSDQSEAEVAIKEASKYGLFFQFIGIGNASFGFLEKLDNMSGRTVDNANFFSVDNVDKMNDNQLYEKLMNEYPEWLKEASQLSII